MSSFELPISEIRVELSYFDICVQRGLGSSLLVFTLEQKTFLIESYFRNGLKVYGSTPYKTA
jgi:hypothetical protein